MSHELSGAALEIALQSPNKSSSSSSSSSSGFQVSFSHVVWYCFSTTMLLKCEPHAGSLPTNNCSDTPFNSSCKPFTAALWNISTGCSKVARFSGVAPSIILLTPCLFRAVILPPHVIQSTMVIMCLILTYMPYVFSTPCISRNISVLAASMPYVFCIEKISLHCMYSLTIDSMECICAKSIPSVSITKCSSCFLTTAFDIFDEPLMVDSNNCFICWKKLFFFLNLAISMTVPNGLSLYANAMCFDIVSLRMLFII